MAKSKYWTGREWCKVISFANCVTCGGKGTIPCEDDQNSSITEQQCPQCFYKKNAKIAPVNPQKCDRHRIDPATGTVRHSLCRRCAKSNVCKHKDPTRCLAGMSDEITKPKPFVTIEELEAERYRLKIQYLEDSDYHIDYISGLKDLFKAAAKIAKERK